MNLKQITRKFSLLLFGICVFSFTGTGATAIHTVYAADNKKGDKKEEKKETAGSLATGDNVKDKDKDKGKGKEGSESLVNGAGKTKEKEEGSLATGGTKNEKKEEGSLATGDKSKGDSDVGDRDGLIDVDPNQEDFDLPDAETSKKNLSTGIDSFMTLLSTILRVAGVILGAYATGKLIMAFHNDNADAKNTAAIMLSMAVIMIAMPSIIDALDIKSFFG